MYTPPTVQCSPSRTLVILGEAPGADEEAAGVPFVGQSGKQLTALMAEAGLDRSQWHILNTFLKRPPNNDLALVDKITRDTSRAWTLNKTEYKREYGIVPPPEPPPLRKRYLRPEHHWQIEELRQRLRLLKPDLIVAMGGTALWALSGESAITVHRGAFFTSPFGRAIATLHPASILYQYDQMPILWSDLVKVRMYLDGTISQPLKRKVWIDPSFAEIAAVYESFRKRPLSDVLGVDIETAPSLAQITTISFAFADEGICIPLWDRYAVTAEKQNYWPTVEDEVKAWRWIAKFCQLPHAKVMQNGMYDSQYMLDAPVQLRLKNWCHDTAVMQHAYQPELKKDLGTLSTLYLNEPSWKHMRHKAADDNKGDE
jgi:uracil-DNA glycosylase